MTTQRNTRSKSAQKYDTTPIEDPSMIGYTAFYRNIGEDKYENKKFSITSLGRTSYQPGCMETITNKDAKSEAQNWFTNNLNINQYERERLESTIQAKFKAVGIETIINNTLLTKLLS